MSFFSNEFKDDLNKFSIFKKISSNLCIILFFNECNKCIVMQDIYQTFVFWDNSCTAHYVFNMAVISHFHSVSLIINFSCLFLNKADYIETV